MVRPRLLTIALAAALGASSCGLVSDSLSSPPVASVEALTVHDSCGTNFTVRDPAGTTRLTLAIGIDRTKAVDPGTFELASDEPGGGFLELGSGLDVWPCHDIGSDFDDEDVQETWTVVSGSIELLDPIVPDEDGGGSTSVRAVLTRAEIKSDDGEVIVFEGVDLFNPQWGFSGG